MEKIGLSINPRRLCFGLSRIGYTPDSAICDIVDNAVDAHAKNITILFSKKSANENRINNVKEYLIIDDGFGMTLEGIKDALALGSSESDYDDGSLSKFGLGLKSASFAQGNRLEVISATKGNEFHKLSVDLELIVDEYFAQKESLSDEDKLLIQKYLPNSHGTIVRIAKIHSSNHPSIRSTKDTLSKRLGIIYYYFLMNDLNIVLDDDDIKPYDVLFTDEAELNGNLDEDEWDGKSTCWISKRKSYTVDTKLGTKCEIEVTQLPYPPIFELDGEDKVGIRNKYGIKAGNYGFYIYRNKRLISWAHGFDGIIPQNQLYYSFRGRILIDSSADDCFNIDVKKANILLSDEASKVIEEVSDQFKKKSKGAWEHAKKLVSQRTGQLPNQISNDIASSTKDIDDLPSDMDSTEQEDIEKQDRLKGIEKKFKNQLKDEAKKLIRDKTGKKADDNEITEKELEEILQGETKRGQQIFQINTLEDNILWKPYYDAEKRNCVRINRNHRFALLLYDDNSANRDLLVLVELLLWKLANAEIYVCSHNLKLKQEVIEEVLVEYRRVASELLADLCRSKDTDLPPFRSDDA